MSLEILKEKWYERNPVHDLDKKGKDRFWVTLQMVFKDYYNKLEELKSTNSLESKD